MTHETNPNAEILRAFAGNQEAQRAEEVNQKLLEERAALIAQMKALQNAHDLNAKRMEALEKAAATRRRTKKEAAV